MGLTWPNTLKKSDRLAYILFECEDSWIQVVLMHVQCTIPWTIFFFNLLDPWKINLNSINFAD
jgi:hypothetical protein